MAISQQQKVDFLLKKIGYTKTKTGLAVDSSLSGTKKAGFAEALPSPLIIADTSLWTESGLIPTTPPGSDTDPVKVYAPAGAIRMTVDTTVAGNRAFLAYTTYNNTSSARLTNWIDTQFGNDYIIQVFKDDATVPANKLSASGSGNNDGWFFDYSAGVLNFNDTNVPSGVSGTNIYIVGYRYIGNTGAPTPGDDFRFTDLVVDRNLKVGGISTFNGIVDINSDLDVDGHTNLDNLSIAGVSTFTGAITANGPIDLNADLDVDGHTNLDNVSIAGVTTAAGNIIANGSIDLAGDIDVDGHTNLDNVSISGVTTAAGAIDLNADLDVDGHTELDNVHISGVTTTAGFLNINAGGEANTFRVEDLTSGRVVLAGTNGELEDNANLTFNGSNLTVGGNVNAVDGVFTGNVSIGGTLTYEDVTNVDAVGLMTAREGLHVLSGAGVSIVSGGLNVTAGVSTFGGALDINNNVVIDGNVDLNGDLDVDGHTNLDNVSVAGVSTFNDDVTIVNGKKILLGNSSTFSVYASGTDKYIKGGTSGELVIRDDAITMQAVSSSDTYFDAVHGGSVSLYWDNSKKFETLQRGVGISGSIHIDNDAYVTGITTTVQLKVGANPTVGIATILDEDNMASNRADALATQQSIKTYVDTQVTAQDLDFQGDSGSGSVDLDSQILDIEGTTDEIETLASGQKIKIGLPNNVTISNQLTVTGTIDANGDLDVDGHTNLDNVSISGVTTAAGAVDINADLDVDGHTNLDNVSISGIATVVDLDVDGHTNLDNVSISGVTTTSGLLNINAGGEANTFRVEDLTSGRVVTVGTGGELQDSSNLTFDGNNLFVSGINVTSAGSGTTTVLGVDIVTRNIKATGISTLQGTVNIESDLDVDGHAEFDNIRVAGIATFGGPITAGSSLGVNGQYMKRTATGVTWDSFPTMRTSQTFTAIAGQTTFSFTYNIGFIDVFHNGVKLTGSEYTASNGTSVVLDVGCFVGDIVELVSYNTTSTGSGGGGVLGISTLATSYFNHINAVGVITASQFYGDGSNLTGVIAAGSGVIVRDSGSNVGTAGTIDFGANLDVSALSAGIVTVTSSGGVAGINTVGFSTLTHLLISGVTTSNGAVNFNGNTVITNLNAGGNSYPTITGNNGQVLTSNGSGSLTWTDKGSATGAGGTWATDTIGINTTKNVGIGTTAKVGYALDVEGNQRVTGILTVGTSSLTLDGVNNKVTVGTAVTLFHNTGLFVGSDSNLHSTGLEIKNVNASGDLDVDGHTNLDNVSISGVTTAAGAIDLNADLDVDGHAEFDNVRVSGVTTTAAVNWGGHMLPTSNAVYDIGSADKKVRHLFLSDNSLKFVDSADAEHPLSVDSGRLKFDGGLLLGSTIKADSVSGVVTATSFIGNGSGLTGVVASGTGIVIKDNDSTVGTAGTINFATGLNVSPASAGIVTVTAGVTPSTSAPSSPAAGQLWWKSDEGRLKVYYEDTNTSQWVDATPLGADTTYDLTGSANTTNQAIISLTPNSGTADTIELLGANGTSLTWDSANKRVTFDSVAPVNPDWDATSGISSIRNKPTIPSAYTLPIAAAGTLGGIKVGANLTINASGVLSANVGGYTLPMAAANTLGGIKIGAGLSIDGNGVVTASGSASTPSIADVNHTTGSIADDATANINITGHKAYTLFKVTVSKPSWVRIYCDSASRTADASRSESNDPTPGSGVIAEVRTTSDNQAVLITPGIQGFNNDAIRNSNIYTSVTNRSGSATAVTVTLTVLQTGS